MAGMYGMYGNMAKLIMQRYEHEPAHVGAPTTTTKGELKMSGAPIILHRRKHLHNGKNAYDIDLYHSICWMKDDTHDAGGYWAHANLHAKKNGIFVSMYQPTRYLAVELDDVYDDNVYAVLVPFFYIFF